MIAHLHCMYSRGFRHQCSVSIFADGVLHYLKWYLDIQLPCGLKGHDACACVFRGLSANMLALDPKNSSSWPVAGIYLRNVETCMVMWRKQQINQFMHDIDTWVCLFSLILTVCRLFCSRSSCLIASIIFFVVNFSDGPHGFVVVLFCLRSPTNCGSHPSVLVYHWSVNKLWNVFISIRIHRPVVPSLFAAVVDQCSLMCLKSLAVVYQSSCMCLKSLAVVYQSSWMCLKSLAVVYQSSCMCLKSLAVVYQCSWMCQKSLAVVYQCSWMCLKSLVVVYQCSWMCLKSLAVVYQCSWMCLKSLAVVDQCSWMCLKSLAVVYQCSWMCLKSLAVVDQCSWMCLKSLAVVYQCSWMCLKSLAVVDQCSWMCLKSLAVVYQCSWMCLKSLAVVDQCSWMCLKSLAVVISVPGCVRNLWL